MVKVGAEVSQDEQQTALRHCPILRMGKVQPGTAFVQEEGRVWVIPQGQCMGCGICTRKVPGKLDMLEW